MNLIGEKKPCPKCGKKSKQDRKDDLMGVALFVLGFSLLVFIMALVDLIMKGG